MAIFKDREGRFLDSVHFPPVLRQYPFPADEACRRGKGVYRISGIVTEEFDCLSIEAEHLEKLPVAEDARYREVA